MKENRLKENQLYDFTRINSQFIQQHCPITFQAEALTTEKGQNYMMVALPKPAKALFLPISSTHSLQSHHISIFEKTSPTNLTKSEYHYTVYFSEENSQNRHYQLHVHFNGKDLVTTKSQLSELQEDGKTYLPVPLDDLAGADELFQSWALEYTHEMMVSIRLLWQEKIKQDKERYAAMTKVLDNLSKNWENNPEPYLAEIQKHIPFLDNITPYHSDQGYFIGIRNILSDIAHMVEEKSQTNSFTVPEHKNSPDTLTFSQEEETSQTEEMVVHTQDTRPSAPVKGNLSSLVKKAEVATLLFQEKCQSSTMKVRAELLSTAIQLTQVANLFSTDKDYQKTPADLILLQSLLHTQSQHQEKILLNLLLNDKIDEADALDNFANDGFLLSHVCSALKLGKHKLLEFILKRIDFPINTFTITTPIGNVSAAMYCFLNDSPTSPKTACLSVLVKHGASLFEACPTTGLPLAHMIMSANPRHPCMLAIEENEQKTLANPSFNRQMISLLKEKIAEPELNEATVVYRTLDNYVKSYPSQTPSEIKALQDKLKLVSPLEEIKSKNKIFALLSSDPEITTKTEELYLYRDQYWAKSKKPQEKAMARKSEKEMIQEFCSSYEANQDKSYESVKKEYLDAAQEEISSLKQKLELSSLNIKKSGGGAIGSKKDLKALKRIALERNRNAQEEKKQSRGRNRLFTHLDNTLEGLKLMETMLGGITAAERNVRSATNEEEFTNNLEALSEAFATLTHA